MMADADVETTAAAWQEIAGNAKDTQDIKTLREEHGSMDVSLDRIFPAGSGLILRKGNRPCGYILFEVSDRQSDSGAEHSLLIQHFYTSKEVRGIGSILKIIQLLREQAERRNCKSVMWRPITPMEMTLTKRMKATREGNYYVFPVEQLNARAILGGL